MSWVFNPFTGNLDSSGSSGSGGDMTKAVYDTNDNGIVDEAAVITGQGALATLDEVTNAQIANGTIGTSNLSTAVTNSLALADTSTQPADIANFETTAELNARDTANRSRANHTGTQLASTISDFDTEVSNNASVIANTAKLTCDTTNVTSAGALMDSELTSEASVKALDQGVATTDSPTFSGATIDGKLLVAPTSGTGKAFEVRNTSGDEIMAVSFGGLLTMQNFSGGDATGNLNFGGGSAFNNGGNILLYGGSHASLANDIRFRATTTTVGTWDDSANNWAFYGNATIDDDLTVDTNTLHVDSTNGRVGMGNTSPAEVLDVTGNIAVSGTVDGRDIATNIPASLGTAGQVLTVNTGATAAEWADAGGGGGVSPSKVVIARKTSNQQTNSTTYQKITFNTEDRDTNSEFSGGTYTASGDGFRRFILTTTVNSNNVSGVVDLTVKHNGVEKNWQVSRNDDGNERDATTLVYEENILDGDTVDFHFKSNSSSYFSYIRCFFVDTSLQVIHYA